MGLTGVLMVLSGCVFEILVVAAGAEDEGCCDLTSWFRSEDFLLLQATQHRLNVKT